MEDNAIQHTALTTASLLDRHDAIEEQLGAAIAIMDCVRLVASVEQSAYKIRDGSMSCALTHAMKLVEQANDATDEIFRIAIGNTTEVE